MFRFSKVLLIALVLIGGGWLIGSLYPAPTAWTAPIKGRADPLLAQLDLGDLEHLRASLSAEDFDRLAKNAAILAASTGDVIRVERADAPLDEHAEDAAGQQAAIIANAADVEDALMLCPGMRVSNAPAADANRRITNYVSAVSVNGVALAVNPTRGACLSSGFGPRGGGQHKGLDLHARDGGPIFAAAAGVVIERLYRDDYGNVLLIDHGAGVYTRYAHLSSFAANVTSGAQVAAGQQIGLMGNTAAYQIPVHLHYEVLLGDYDNPRRSFGLTPRSPLSFPPALASVAVIGVPRATPPAATAPSPIADPPPSATRTADTQASASTAPRAACIIATIGEVSVVTVHRGDTLAEIARACYGSEAMWPSMVTCNDFLNRRNLGGVSPLSGGDLLYVGDRLILPSPDGDCPDAPTP